MRIKIIVIGSFLLQIIAGVFNNEKDRCLDTGRINGKRRFKIKSAVFFLK